ncbi:hypothetical protein [Dokdonella soli]|uniref:Uncharacterized protein n=1 Tax=Dokdonella soli TaxID=529810 RepID=A0ABN1IY01_9GAMM
MRQISYAIFVATCCAAVAQLSPAADAPDHREGSHNPNPVLFAKDARPFGRSMTDWAQSEAQWLRSIPLAQNPFYDQTGEFCALDQQGPVWFIPPIGGPSVFSGVRTCTVPHHKAIFLDIGHDTDEYPCPALPHWQPAPGQSLYDFLVKDDNPVMNSVNALEVSLDGQPLSGVLAYRYISNDVFDLTSDLSLQAHDSCITGLPQQTLLDGFYMMFKPLDRGQHTIVVFGTNTFGDNKTYTYHLTVE